MDREVPALSVGQATALDKRMKKAREDKFLESSRKRLDNLVSQKILYSNR